MNPFAPLHVVPARKRRLWRRRFKRRPKSIVPNIAKVQKPNRALKVGTQNIDGMSEIKLPDLQQFLTTQNLGIFVISEVKKQEGELLSSYEIPGYSLTEHLRMDTKSGGLATYVKDGLDCRVEVDSSSKELHKVWLDSERVWIKVSGALKVAICTVYLRCNQPKDSAYYQNNVTLLEEIKMESSVMRQQGFQVLFQGDFNSHVGNVRPYGIQGSF